MEIKKIFDWWAGGSSYSSDAQAVFNRMATELSAPYKNAIAAFIDGQVAASQWTKVTEFWLFANDTQTNSLKGWKGVANATLVGSPTFSSTYGFLLNGTTQYINSNFIPSVNAVGGEDNFSVGALLKENLSTANDVALFGCSPSGGAGHIGLRQTPTSAAIKVFANVNTALDVSEGANDDRIFDSETEYTAVQNAGIGYLYKDGLNILSAARVNTGLSSVNLLFGAHLSNVTVISFLNCKISVGYVVDPTGFDYRAFHLGIKTMLQTLGVYSTTPELTIPTGGEWFDFSQATLGTFASLLGRKSLLTAIASSNAPNVEVEAASGVRVIRCESANSEAVDLSSVFQTFYDGTLPSSFSILVTLKPIDGSPAADQVIFGHSNGLNAMFAKITTAAKVQIGFKEAAQAEIHTLTDFAAFNNSPTAFTILIFEFLKDEMIVYVNGIRVNQTEDSWGTRALTDFDGGVRNIYLGARNVDGTITDPFDGYIGDFMIRRGAWSQSQKERLFNYFS